MSAQKDKSLFDEIEAQLGDGWGVTLISTVTPGLVRLQLCGKDEMYEARACAEGATLAEALQRAIAFTKATDVDEYESRFWNDLAHWGLAGSDEPGCACPKCDKWMSQYDDEDASRQVSLGFTLFICSRCGTQSVWDLDSAFPILIEKPLA